MKKLIIENLNQLTDMLQHISVNDYRQKVPVMSGASIAQHIRHILEFYLILTGAGKSGRISYDNRKRDKTIETTPLHALFTIEKIKHELEYLDEKQEVLFEADFSSNGELTHSLNVTILREMAYCLEHSIHHQALIKTGLIALNITEIVNENFGVAYSTLRYRNKLCAQ